MFLAFKEMKKEKTRFFLIIIIFVLISYLVYFLLGLANGLASDNRTAIEHWNADRIVLSNGSNNNINSSMIDQDVIEKDLEGKDYELINLSRAVAYINGKETDENTVNIVLLGTEENSKARPEVLEGREIEDDYEVIGASSLRDKDGVELGDKLKLSMNDAEFTVVGFTDDYKFNVAPVVYTKLHKASAAFIQYKPQYDKAQNQTQAGEQTPAEAGQMPPAEAGQTPVMDGTSQATPAIPERVSAAVLYGEDDDFKDLKDDYDIITIDEFIKEIPGYTAQLLTFALMIGFLIVIAAIVLGVFLYIITIQKKQTFGIMKIQGISNAYIGKSVIVQTFLVSLIGLMIGIFLTWLTEQFLPATVPFKSDWTFYGIITLLMMITSQIGAIFSVRSVSKVDPLEVI